MPKRRPESSFKTHDGDGHQLEAVWSRSGKHLRLSVALWSSFISASASLDREQVQALVAVLSDDTSEPLSLITPAEGVDVEANWERNGRVFAIKILAVRGIGRRGLVSAEDAPYKENANRAELSGEQASEFLAFLETGPPESDDL